jgi:hypothetical protein
MAINIIPDGALANDSITIGFGSWQGTLDGNDTLFLSATASQWAWAGAAIKSLHVTLVASSSSAPATIPSSSTTGTRNL